MCVLYMRFESKVRPITFGCVAMASAVLFILPFSISLLGFGMGTILANFHMCGIMLVLRAVFNMLVRNASPIGPISFMCLMFSLSGLCEVLFLLCFIVSWTWVVVSVVLYSIIALVA